METMSHQGYFGSVEYSEPDGVFHGKVLNIRGLVTYEAPTQDGLLGAFKEAVEDFIDHALVALDQKPKPEDVK